MSATTNNGVDCGVGTRRVEPAEGVRDDACHNGTQPSHHGVVGARIGEKRVKKPSDDACHNETQPSHHGVVGARVGDERGENASDDACHNGTQPSPHGGFGARSGAGRAENPSDDACHNGPQPSHHGGFGEGARDGAPEKHERDAMGRFAPGNKGGPGNPFGRMMGMLRCALVRRLKPEDVEAIADVLIAKATAGDVAAARLVLSYGIGKPTEAVNPDTLDMQEWDVFRKSPVSLDDLRGIVEGIPVDAMGPVVRVTKPYLNANAVDTIMSVLKPEPKPKLSRKERREARRRRRRVAEAGEATPIDERG
jgi:hypothetical protein